MRIRYAFSFFVLMLFLCASISIPTAIFVFRGNGAAPLTFVIDAGHGGEDGGAVGADGTLESEVNLAVALRLEQMLALCGFPAVMTRRSEEISYPDAAKTIRDRKRADQEYRAALINGTDGAVLLSIHQNQYSTAGPRGAQVFYSSTPGSEDFAKEMQARLAVLCGDHRKAAPISPEIFLLKEARCPAILIECGFLSNPEELCLLQSETYQTKLAVVMTAACIARRTELEKAYGKG